MSMISAVVILYYPDNTINKNLLPIISLVERLYIVDNTEIAQIDVIDPAIVNSQKLKYIHTGNNEGIARPLNNVCQLAKDEGYRLLLTMDQDSFFDKNILKNYISYIENFFEISSVGMFGVSHIEMVSSQNSNSDFEEGTQIITSGSVVNLDNFHAIGNFDERLFIDQVDSEYCFRILQAGFKIIKFKNVSLDHKLGTLNEYFSMKSLKKTSRSLHPPLRIYYMVRNFFYVSNKYRNVFPKEIKDLNKDILNRIKNNFLYGNDRLKLIALIIRGYLDFRHKRMGKIAS